MPASLHPVFLGLDFDNTIVSYDEVFYLRAIERGMIPDTVERSKLAVRTWLRAQQGGERTWVELAGDVYGSCMDRAVPTPGVLDCIERAATAGIQLAIVSHQTVRPLIGRPVNLHDAARGWLSHHGLASLGIPPTRWYFEVTQELKLARIRDLGCTHFVDDLWEIFASPSFPPGVHQLLYAPPGPAPQREGAVSMGAAYASLVVDDGPIRGLVPSPRMVACASWDEVAGHLATCEGRESVLGM
jgi:hypothetical protein